MIGRSVRIVCAIAVVLSIAACRRQQNSGAPKGQKGFIAVVGSGTDDPAWPAIRAAALRYQQTAEPIDIRTGAPAESSTLAQMDLIRHWHKEGLRGVCVQVTDPDAAEKPLSELRQAGVIVVTMGMEIDLADPFLHVGPAQRSLGKALADLVPKARDGRSTWGVLYSSQSAAAITRRREAFMDQIAIYADIRVLHELDCRGSPAEAVRQIRTCMERYPDLGGWVSLDNWPLRGPIGALPLLPSGCVMITVDPLPPYWRFVEDGTVTAAIINRYDIITDEAITLCLHSVQNHMLFTRAVDSPFLTVTSAERKSFAKQWSEWTETTPGGPGS